MEVLVLHLENETSKPIDNGSVGGGDEGLMWTSPEAIAVPIVFFVIFVVGVIGNGTLIFTVLRNKNMQNIPNILIVSLALGDLLLILVSVPFTATIYTFKYWPYGEEMCKMNEFLQTLSLGVSVFTLTALSGDRFLAIVYPMRMHRGSPKLRTMSIAAGIWVLSIGLALLDLMGSHIVTSHSMKFCNLFPRQWGEWYPKFHCMFRFAIYFAAPMLIIASFYSSMAWILWLSGRRMPGEAQRIMGNAKNNAKKQMEGRKKVAKLILSFIVVFIICWLPRHVYLLWFHYDPGDYNLFWHIFKIIGFCLCFINSCINPLALYFLSQQFRRCFNRYLFCCCPGVVGSRRETTYYSDTNTMNQIKLHRNGLSETGVTASESVLWLRILSQEEHMPVAATRLDDAYLLWESPGWNIRERVLTFPSKDWEIPDDAYSKNPFFMAIVILFIMWLGTESTITCPYTHGWYMSSFVTGTKKSDLL